MTAFSTGILLTLVFVLAEALQFVYFGAVFQAVSPFLFGFLAFAVVTVAFLGGVWWRHPDQIALVRQHSGSLLGLNATAALAWLSYLTSVMLIEPAVVYTISAGIMPAANLVLRRLVEGRSAGVPRRLELAGTLLLLVAVIYLGAITVTGQSGFVRGDDSTAALLGVLLAIADGIFFTWMLVFSSRLNIAGAGPAVVFGSRFCLYIVVAGIAVAADSPATETPPPVELVTIVVIGLLLTVPHLYALQFAVSRVSTTVISALTTLGPFSVFLLQMVEGRVYYSNATLAGLAIYFTGSWLTVLASLGRSDSGQLETSGQDTVDPDGAGDKVNQ